MRPEVPAPPDVPVPPPEVIVVGLGPGDPRLVSVAAGEAIAATEHRFVRTTRHPSASVVEPAVSFDALYERSETLDDVYREVVETLAASAVAHGRVLYAVPGSPAVAERTVEMLRSDERVSVIVIPALSFLDLAWDRLGVDPIAAGVRLVDGHRFAVDAAGHVGPFLVAQCDSRLVLSEIKLAVEDGPRLTVLQRLGLPDESVRKCDWVELDRTVDADHLTCLWIPRLAEPVAAELVRFTELVRLLRGECPWDRRQTHQSLARHLLEETYETLEAIDEVSGPDGYEHLEEELGDLLFQVAFHSLLATEAGHFTFADVARTIHDKLVERHPHVFGPPGTPQPNWEESKKAEKGRASVMDGVPGNLPSLLYAAKVQSKAASVGFDWDSAAGAWTKLHEELKELDEAIAAPGSGTSGVTGSATSGVTGSATSGVPGSATSEAIADELGDVLFSVVNVARHLGIDAELALREAGAKFGDRFKAMEILAAARGVAIGDELWEEVKKVPREHAP